MPKESANYVSWEKVGTQELPSGGRVFTGYQFEMWRCSVPGGWFVLIEGSAAVPFLFTFYPDPEHDWNTGDDTLLRPANLLPEE